MKRFILGFGLLGLVGCFLPFALGLSWFDMRQLGVGWTVWTVLAAYLVPVCAAASRTESAKVAAVVGTASFGFLAYKFGTGTFDLVIHASIGGMMMGVAVIGGLASSLLGLAASKR